MMKKYYLIGLLAISLIFVIACTQTKTIPENKICSVDTDCIPAGCCHSNDTVNLKFAPDCSSIMCTMECVPNTLDCGQGEVKCVERECKVMMKS
jgi:hypothetical protein